MPIFKHSDFIRFTYRFHTGASPHEPRVDDKEVVVLNPSWQGMVHAIDLKRVTPAEREVLEFIFDPANRGKRHKLSLVNDILGRMDPPRDVLSPAAFYVKFVKPFVRDKDAYRTYFPERMQDVKVLPRKPPQHAAPEQTRLGQDDATARPAQPAAPGRPAKPLFKKNEASQERLAEIRKAAERQRDRRKP